MKTNTVKTTEQMIKEAITQMVLANTNIEVMRLANLILTLQADRIRELEQDKAMLVKRAA